MDGKIRTNDKMTTLQQSNCQLLYPEWATNKKAGYQCCLGAMSPMTLRKPAIDQARHIVKRCHGMAIDRSKIAQLGTAGADDVAVTTVNTSTSGAVSNTSDGRPRASAIELDLVVRSFDTRGTCPPNYYDAGYVDAHDEGPPETRCVLSSTGPAILGCGDRFCGDIAGPIASYCTRASPRACPEHYESVATTSVLGCKERICRKKGLDPPVYYCGKYYCAPDLNQLSAGFLDRDSAHPCPSGYHARGTVDGTWPFSYMECRK
jgi:hypothetical protein